MAPEFGRPIHQLPLIPADVLKKHRVHEPLDTRFRSAARLLQALWREDQDLPLGSYEASAANSEVEFPNRPAGAAAISSPPRSPIAPARGCLPRNRRAYRRGTARDKPPFQHAAHLQPTGAMGAHTRTRVELSDRTSAGFHRGRAPAPLRTFARPRQPKIYGRFYGLRHSLARSS
jgi:hypothetical protein